jgi:hypothetical protein
MEADRRGALYGGEKNGHAGGMLRALGRLVLLAATAVLCLDCHSDRPNADASVPPPADSGGGFYVVEVAIAAGDGQTGVVIPNPFGGQPTDAAPPAEVTFGGEEPAMTCSDSAACLIPAPVCGEICVEAGCQTTSWLRYLDRPRCEDGRCRFDRGYIKCDWRCYNGQCSTPPTL